MVCWWSSECAPTAPSSGLWFSWTPETWANWRGWATNPTASCRCPCTEFSFLKPKISKFKKKKKKSKIPQKIQFSFLKPKNSKFSKQKIQKFHKNSNFRSKSLGIWHHCLQLLPKITWKRFCCAKSAYFSIQFPSRMFSLRIWQRCLSNVAGICRFGTTASSSGLK